MEPFFISTEEKPFDPTKFYSVGIYSLRSASCCSQSVKAVLGPSLEEDEEVNEGLLPDSISVSRIDDLLAQLRFREMPKRSLFSIPFELAEGFVIGVKGCVKLPETLLYTCICSLLPTNATSFDRYGLVTEQKKGKLQILHGSGRPSRGGGTEDTLRR